MSRISVGWAVGVIAVSFAVLFLLWSFSGRFYENDGSGTSAFHRAADVQAGNKAASTTSSAGPGESFAAYGPPKDPFRELLARAKTGEKSPAPARGGRKGSHTSASGRSPTPSRPPAHAASRGTSSRPASSEAGRGRPVSRPTPASSHLAGGRSNPGRASGSATRSGALFDSGGNLPLP